MTILAVDFGSTFTKAALFDDAGTLLRTASTPTTGPQTGVLRSDILDGYHALRAELAVADDATVHACSSAGGGLRLAVVGYEPSITSEAGHRVGLSAGSKVVHVASGRLDRHSANEIRAAKPDIILLVGGTDGGNGDVLVHNADRLAKVAIGGHGERAVPIVLAGNREARAEALEALATTDRPVIIAENVLPEIGVIAPESARAAIREAFLTHVIGGKRLSRDPAFAQMVEAATPDAMLRGVEVLSGVDPDGDVMVIDIGGATTDVYSSITAEGENAIKRRTAVAPLMHARTVEGDLGMRWNALHVVEAALSESLDVPTELREYAAHVHERPGVLPESRQQQLLDLDLARLAALVAVRRHARPSRTPDSGRPVGNVNRVIGSGGVLRATGHDAQSVLAAVLSDHAGGWTVPKSASADVDRRYLLFAAGLLAANDPTVAAAIAAQI